MSSSPGKDGSGVLQVQEHWGRGDAVYEDLGMAPAEGRGACCGADEGTLEAQTRSGPWNLLQGPGEAGLCPACQRL